MDDTDLSIFRSKNRKKDNADASTMATTPTSEAYQNRIITSRPTTEDTYPNCPRAGVALILNHKEVKAHKMRMGTERDRDAIKKSLLSFGFDVRAYNELTFAEISDLLQNGD